MGLIQSDLLEYYTGEIASLGGSLTARERSAVELLLIELESENLLSKLRYLALFVGDGTIAFQIPTVFRTRMTVNGTPTITYSRRGGIQVAGNATNALRTGFVPSSNGLNRRNQFKAVYSLAAATAGVVLGGGVGAGAAYNGGFLGFHDSPTSAFTSISGAAVTYAQAELGLQSVSVNSTNITSRNRYLQIQSVANPASTGTEPIGESLILNHWNGGTNFASNGRLGAVVEGVSLTQQQTGILSGILDRFHYRIERRQALDMVFAGDSITFGVGVSESGNRFSTQLAASIGVIENNQGASGSALQSGSRDATVAPWINRYNSQITQLAPAFVGLMIGTNDISIGPEYNVSAYSANLRTVLTDLINAGMFRRNIFVSSIPWASDAWYATFPVGSRNKVLAYNREIESISRSFGVNFVDTYAYMAANGGDSLLADDLHPNDAGARAIAENWAKVFYLAM